MSENEQPENMDALLALAQQADTEGWNGDQIVESAESATAQEQKAEATPEGSVSPGADKSEVTPSQEQSQPAESSTPAETQAEIDYRAEYERQKKELERRERSWQKINEEKEALAKLRATVRPDETRIPGDQFSAEEYEAYAEKAIEDGGPDAVKVARQAMTRAKQIRQEKFQEDIRREMNEAVEENPELADQASPLAKAVQELLQDRNSVGFKGAVKLAKAKQLADSIPGLKGEIEKHKAEIDRLNKALAVGGKSGVPKRDAPKRFEDMSLEEQEAHMRARAEEADTYAY